MTGRHVQRTLGHVQRTLGHARRTPSGEGVPGRNTCEHNLQTPRLRPETHRLVLGGHFLGRGTQGRSGLGADPAWGHHHHLALLGRELGQDVRLEAPQHDRFLQQQLQLSQAGGARVIPSPGVLWREKRDTARLDPPWAKGTGPSRPGGFLFSSLSLPRL